MEAKIDSFDQKVAHSKAAKKVKAGAT